MKSFAFASVLSAVATGKPTSTIVELAIAEPSLSTLVTAVVAANLDGALGSAGPFTVFAPNNDAFKALGGIDDLLKPENKKLLVALLDYHVVPGKVAAADLDATQDVPTLDVRGKKLRVTKVGDKIQVIPPMYPDPRNLRTVISADNFASNGVVHIIDGVIPIPLINQIHSAKPTLSTIVELAIAEPSLSTLVTAVVAANLDGALGSAGPFTVFAPNNDAFKALGGIDDLLKPENKKLLVALLDYHVVPGKVAAADLDATQDVPTLDVRGKKLRVTKVGDKIQVIPPMYPDPRNLRTVISADNFASNGVVHIIDGVIPIPLINQMPSLASGTAPCCKACVAPLVKYYSVDARRGFCGETCIKPSSYSIFKVFEKNLTLSDSDTPCSEEFTPAGTHYTEYSDTVTHGDPLGLLSVTLDLYGPGATVVVV